MYTFGETRMKIAMIVWLALFALPTVCQEPKVLNPGDPGYKLPSGVTVMAELTKAIDAKKAAVGDEVQAKVEQDMVYEGKVMVPVDSKIVGHVRAVKASSKDDQESRLRIEFEKIVLKNGSEMPFEFPGLVVAVAPERREALNKSNLSDLPVKAELGKAADRVNANPNIQGANSGMNAGLLYGTARGVIGFKGLELVESPEGPVIVAKKNNIKFDYGTQMVLIVATPAGK